MVVFFFFFFFFFFVVGSPHKHALQNNPALTEAMGRLNRLAIGDDYVHASQETSDEGAEDRLSADRAEILASRQAEADAPYQRAPTSTATARFKARFDEKQAAAARDKFVG